MGREKKVVKKVYGKPSYEVEEIFEKMSLACPNPQNARCKTSTSTCPAGTGGQIQVS